MAASRPNREPAPRWSRALALVAAAALAVLGLNPTPAHADSASLTLIAEITNDSGGRAQLNDVVMTAKVGSTVYDFSSDETKSIPGLAGAGDTALLAWEPDPLLGGYTGSWTCERVDGDTVKAGVDQVQLAPGQDWACTLNLEDGPGVAWSLVDATDENTFLPGSEWSLTGAFADGSTTKLVVDCIQYYAAACIMYRDQDLRSGAFLVGYAIPGETYTLKQSAPPNGYAVVAKRTIDLPVNGAANITDLGPLTDKQMLTASLTAEVGTSVTTAVQNGTMNFGDSVLYTTTLHNLNSKPIANVVINLPVPGGLTLDQASLACSPGCEAPTIAQRQVSVDPPVTQTDVTWKIASLPAGAVAAASFKALLPYPAAKSAVTWRGTALAHVIADAVGDLNTSPVTLSAYKAASHPSLLSEVGSSVSVWVVLGALVVGILGLGLVAFGLKQSRRR